MFKLYIKYKKISKNNNKINQKFYYIISLKLY